MASRFDLVCVSHLRWDFVYQRPQHLLSRAVAEGRRVIYLEEPISSDGPARLETRQTAEGVLVCVPQLPSGLEGEAAEFEQSRLLREFLTKHDVDAFVLWLYTPMAVPLVRDLR